MYIIESVNTRKDGVLVADMTKVGLTPEYCLMNGTPTIVMIDGVPFFFSSTVYNEKMSDVDHLHFKGGSNKHLYLMNK